jgi:hypothetical protein
MFLPLVIREDVIIVFPLIYNLILGGTKTVDFAHDVVGVPPKEGRYAGR